MSLTLYFHPLASFCMKALIALYENDIPFKGEVVDLGDEASRAAFLRVWPIARFPVLRDESANRTVPESSIIIEYLAQRYPGPSRLIPGEAEAALETRARDRMFDLYVHEPMQKIIGDRIRPQGRRDPHGVEQARATLHTAFGILEQELATRTWATGSAFSMADCAAAPTLFFTDLVVMPLAERYPALTAYLERLQQRPSFARVLREAQPYLHWVPREPAAA
jgi:glutathione S-transferase